MRFTGALWMGALGISYECVCVWGGWSCLLIALEMWPTGTLNRGLAQPLPAKPGAYQDTLLPLVGSYPPQSLKTKLPEYLSPVP